jgi:CBS domain-containing protein
MRIQNILDRNRTQVIRIHPTETVKSVADPMRAHNIAALVVKNGTAITGLILDHDMIHAVWQQRERARSMAVLDVVTHTVITVAPNGTLKRAMSLMTSHPVRDLPVIANGRFIGIVGIGDVVKHRLEIWKRSPASCGTHT